MQAALWLMWWSVRLLTIAGSSDLEAARVSFRKWKERNWFSALMFTPLSVVLLVVLLWESTFTILCFPLPLAGCFANSLYISLFALTCASLCAMCRPSRGALLSLGGSLPQRDAPPRWPVCQNQRCVGDPAGVAAADQASWERAVWGGLDGYGSSRLWKKRPHGRGHTEPAETPDLTPKHKQIIRPGRGGDQMRKWGRKF